MDCYLKIQGGTFSLVHRFNVEGSRTYARRNCVDGFSSGSRRRMLKYLRSCVANYGVFGTLTFPSGSCLNIESFQSAWRIFVERWRRVYGANHANSLFWFVEFTRGGEPHFHFFANHYIEKGWLAVSWSESIRELCSAAGTWSAAIAKASTRIESIRGGRDAICQYASKYAAKEEQKSVPDLFKNKAGGFRYWGVVGCRDVVAAAIVVDSFDYVRFELYDLVNKVKNLAGEPIFCDYGATVWVIRDKKLFFDLFKGFAVANKMLLQAFKDRETDIQREKYRKDSGRGDSERSIVQF